jgi:hypothetical protein
MGRLENTTLRHGKPWWIDADREKPKNSEKNLSQCNSVHYKFHMD